MKQKKLHIDSKYLLEVGKRIADIRRKNGLNQAEFAEILNTSRAIISQIEIGRTEPSLKIIRQIAAKCSISYEYLLDGEETALSVAAEETAHYGNTPDIKTVWREVLKLKKLSKESKA